MPDRHTLQNLPFAVKVAAFMIPYLLQGAGALWYISKQMDRTVFEVEQVTVQLKKLENNQVILQQLVVDMAVIKVRVDALAHKNLGGN